MSRIDLHTHTTASDGSLTPTELVAAAEKAGIRVLTVTDHDTFDGLDEAISAGAQHGVRVITGVEFSVDHESGSLHLLGYGFNHKDEELNRIILELVESRKQRNARMIDRMREFGFRISYEDIAAQSQRGTLGRAHIAQWLIATGQVESFELAFERFLGKGRAAYVDRKRLSLRDACRLIHDAGGAAVWAHPGLHWANLDGLLEKLPQWRQEGLDGLESDYSAHSVELRDRIRRLAQEHGMIFTGGSDFHGAIRPGLSLGEGPEGGEIADECWNNLEKRLAEIHV